MKIKKAELLTGLTTKTIRFYENQGLICVNRSENGYREYSDENIKELKCIKILRKLNVSISKIKELNSKNTTLQDILYIELKEIDKSELNLVQKKCCIETMLKDLRKNKDIDLVKYYNDFEEIENEEFKEILMEFKELSKFSLVYQILITIMLISPILRLFFNIKRNYYYFMTTDSIFAIISTIILTLLWSRFLKQTNKNLKGIGYMFLSTLISLISCILIYLGVSILQQKIFVPKEYLMIKVKEPYSYLIFIFEIEIIIITISMFYKRVRSLEWKWAVVYFDFMKRNIGKTIIVNIIILYVTVTGITVVTNSKIIDYSFCRPLGGTYYYSDISKVETGFKVKQHLGEFYYIVQFKDGNKINFCQSNSEFEDTYLELEVFDEIIMKKQQVEKISSKNNYKLCDFDKRYVNRFLKIIGNKH